MANNVRIIPQSVLDYFEYNELSPTGIVWKKPITNKIATIGRPAGSFNYRHKYKSPSGIRVMVDGISYLVHRVIVMLRNKELGLDDVVDHIDGNPFNNKIENLRIVDLRTNLRNRKLDGRNTSGYSGVSWGTGRNSSYAICSYLDENNKRKHKHFSVKQFGLLPAYYNACCFRVEILQALNKLGANYHELHGKARA